MTWRSSFVVAALMATLMPALGIGCGGGTGTKPGGSGSTGGAGGGAPSGEIDRPCPDAMRMGGFELVMVAPTATVVGYAQVTGSVQDKADPSRVWHAVATDGACRLMVGPTCSTNCTLPNVCDGDTCVSGPTTKMVGTVMVTGLSQPVSAMPNSQMTYYVPLSSSSFPPFSPGADVQLTTSGGDYAPFSLHGRGFPAIETPSATLPFEMGHAFTATWTPPPSPVATRMFVKIDIAVHGTSSSQIQCNVPDTGSVTVPASLVDALFEKGTTGFPTAFLIRRTVDSVNTGPGCVDFSITTTFNGNTGIQLTIPGVVSCTEDSDCPNGTTCGPTQACR